MKKGTIKSITNDKSGLQTITFEDGTKVLIENFGIRQLEVAFENPLGKTILYKVNEYNIVASFDFERMDKERTKKEKVMTDQQKVSDLCYVLEEIFSYFRPLELPGLTPGTFFECILGWKHLDRLKTRYTEIKKED